MAAGETRETAPPVEAKQAKTGPFPAGLDALLARAKRRKWLIAAASLAALAAAYASTLPIFAVAAGWLLIVIAALLTPAGARSHGRETAVGASAVARASSAVPAVQALIAALPDPCLLLTGDGRIVHHNDAASELLGRITPGRPVSTLLRAPEIGAALREAVRSGAAKRVDYFERVPIDRWFAAHIAPIDGAEGPGRAAFLLLLHDLTKQQRVERMRVDFIANASHELRTPLAALAGFIETLQGPARDDPEARARFLDIMRGQAQRMSRLVDDLLSLSRIELNAHIRPSERVDLATVVAGVADSLTPLAAGSGVEIEVARPDGPVPVAGDRDELAQVFQNLIENAIKYGASGGRIEVTVEAGGHDDVSVAVRDHGPGIAAEHLPRLTERFYRVDVASSREKGGTGLGLAIVKHILNRHRGTLHVASTPGEGATFMVRLKLSEDEAGRGKAIAG